MPVTSRASTDQRWCAQLPSGAVEEFVLEQDEDHFDLAFAVRVDALDGRLPEASQQSVARLRTALAPVGRLLVDGGDPLREVPW